MSKGLIQHFHGLPAETITRYKRVSYPPLFPSDTIVKTAFTMTVAIDDLVHPIFLGNLSEYAVLL